MKIHKFNTSRNFYSPTFVKGEQGGFKISLIFPSPKRILLNYKKGSLLIEVLLSLIILSVSLTLIIRSLLSSLSVATYYSDYSEAISILENKMSQVLENNLLNKPLEENIRANFDEKYQHSFNQSEVIIGETTDTFILNEVQLNLDWRSGSKNKKLSLTTYLWPYSNKE